MKFLNFAMFDVDKAAEVAAAGDKTVDTPGTKLLAQYVCQGIPFPGAPPNTVVVVSVSETESNEAITATQYPLGLAGAAVWSVPVLELPVGGAAEEEKKFRG